MAHICERIYQSGRIVWKVVLRKKGYPSFYLTFDDREEAIKWIRKNQKAYWENPGWYLNWKEELYYIMVDNDEKVRDHIVLPKISR